MMESLLYKGQLTLGVYDKVEEPDSDIVLA
jgi:hypothetical protein